MKDLSFITLNLHRVFLSVKPYTLPLLCALATLYVLTFPLQDPDTFWHLAYGRAMLTEGRFINHEIFSYTAAGTYLGSHSQLAQVLLYLLWLAGGINTLLAFKLLVGLITFLFVMRTAQLYTLSRGSAALLALLVIVAGMTRFVERPEIFTILLQALLLLILFGYSRGEYSVRALWLLPAILVTWDYLHGALFGLAILLTFTFGETLKTCFAPKVALLARWSAGTLQLARLKTLWLWNGITLLAMTFHPNGLWNYLGFWRVASHTAEYALFGEFMSTPFLSEFFGFWLLVGILLLLGLLCFRRLDITALLVVIPFLYLGLKFNRATLAFAMAAVPMLAHCLAMLSEGPALERWRRKVMLALAAVILIAVPYHKAVALPERFQVGIGLNENAFPVGSTRFIEAVGLQGNMFNTDGAGGYLSFFLAPQRKIFNYNQPGVFTALTEYLHKPESRSRWDIRYALTAEPQEWKMFLRDGFVPVYWEPNGMVLLKPEPALAPLLEKYQIRHFDPYKSLAELETLSKTPGVSARLSEEIAIYLTYRRDARLAVLLGKLLLPSNPDLPVELKQRRVWLEAALGENQGSPHLLKALGDIAYRQGDLARAIACFDEILLQNPADVEVLLNRGYIEYDRKAYREAAAIFTKAVQAGKGESGPHYALGLAAMRLGDKEVMQREFQLFLKLAPESPFAGKARQFLAEGRQ